MTSRLIVASALLIGSLVPASFAMSGDSVAGRQSAIVRFDHPTWVGTELLVGSYLVAHDEGKMARGEPCTSFYRLSARTHPLEEVVSFHCIPRERKVVRGFTVTVHSNPVLGIDTLTEYQFAGDSEGHGVPIPALASNRLPEALVCAR